jgi:hypothetical protein
VTCAYDGDGTGANAVSTVDAELVDGYIGGATAEEVANSELSDGIILDEIYSSYAAVQPIFSGRNEASRSSTSSIWPCKN